MKQFNSNQKFGQVITKEEIENWNSDVIFEGGTATGKTWFVTHNLKEHCVEHGKRVLFICNRLELSSQVKKDVLEADAQDIIRVETYQSLENRIMNNIMLSDLEGYHYLVLDEFHYGVSDSNFNIYTDLSYEWIMKQDALRIFMSATCDSLFNIFLNKGYVHPDNHYYIPKDYSYVKKIVFYSRRNDADTIIENIMNNTDDKIIYFCQSMDKLIEMYEKYEDNATFFCSKWTKNEKAKQILEANKGRIAGKTFEGRILLASQALDVGVTLKDYDIKHIIADIYNHDTLQQCLGRKRIIDETDNCNFYIRTYAKRELNMYRKTNILNELIMFNNDREKFNKTYLASRKLNNSYIYFDFMKQDFTMNKLAFIKLLEDERNLDIMINQVWYNDFGYKQVGIGYKQFILDKLNCPDVPVEYYDNYKKEVKVMSLVDYLKSIASTKLFKDEQKELINIIGLKDARGRLQKSVSLLNAYLKENGIEYAILSKVSRIKDESGKSKTVRYWEVSEGVVEV